MDPYHKTSVDHDSTFLFKDIEVGSKGNGYSSLLELSASNDLISFKQAVEEDGSAIDGTALWYGRRSGSSRMSVEQRTPLMVAALFGSTDVLSYILSAYETCGIDVNQASGSDGATALHLAAASGASLAPEAVRLLVAASADPTRPDALGNLAADLVPTAPHLTPSRPLLEGLLGRKAETEDLGSVPPPEQGLKSSEKKEYPVDLSLPDIKNGVFGTDEFRMYSFKVKPCSRAYSHDWTECPFVHPGENARRRDPRRYHYSCVPCPDFRKGACRRGDACEYAHGVFECWLHPAQYRTRLCKDETGCTRRVCFFAHKPEELRPLYASTGSGVPSPRSNSPSSSLEPPMSPLALGSPSVLMLPSFATSTSAMSPSSLQLSGAGLQGSRLKATRSARDYVTDDQQLLDELSSNFAAQSRLNPLNISRSAKLRSLAAGVSPTNLDEMLSTEAALAQLDAAMLTQLQSPTSLQARQALLGHSSTGSSSSISPAMAQAMLNQSTSSFSPAMAQAMLNQSGSSLAPAMAQAMLNQSGSSLSPAMAQAMLNQSGSSLSPAMAQAMLNSSRSAAFAKRSQSFCDRGQGVLGTMATSPPPTSAFADWGSPNGKLDWGVQGEELSKLRKSASFGFRSNGVVHGGDDPDVSWVQSLVKDGPASSRLGGGAAVTEDSRFGGQFVRHHQELQSAESWFEQIYMEQEQMVA
ncbi:hypothetical protein AMTR_s00007p00102750 [Amborella trichopoda]|uniref:C3H1-type domain-containing protein n=2 Tax=Amborella trichopoda TaxID=13333 RepID=W1PDX7_AMBTC|nr:hypothetical protein AMTR_s00007p00102750 [Amborella trichopoda]